MNHKKNNCNGRSCSGTSGGGGGGFWSQSVWNLWPKSTRTKQSSKYDYKDILANDHHRSYEQQCRTLINSNNEDNLNDDVVREIEMDFLKPPSQQHPTPSPLLWLNNEHDEDDWPDTIRGNPNATPTPPMSPTMWFMPRCMDENQFFSPVKLNAGPERMSQRRRRFQFQDEDCDSLIEKFDKISIIPRYQRKRTSATSRTEKETVKSENKENISPMLLVDVNDDHEQDVLVNGLNLSEIEKKKMRKKKVRLKHQL